MSVLRAGFDAGKIVVDWNCLYLVSLPHGCVEGWGEGLRRHCKRNMLFTVDQRVDPEAEGDGRRDPNDARCLSSCFDRS